jgi:hypothetical protein
MEISSDRPRLPAHARAIAAVIGLSAFIWFMFLSGWLKAVPGSVITRRQNVLFNSDTNIWLDRIVGNAHSPEAAVHPLEIAFWRPPVRGLQHLLEIFIPADYAGIVAARLVVATVHAVGVGFLAFLALRLGVKLPQCILLFITYLLFTSNATASLPEHFGISNGLLSVTFVTPIFLASSVMRTGFIVAMVVLCGGTTITNALYPIAALWQYFFKSIRARLIVLAVAVPLGLAAALLLYLRSYVIHHFINDYSTFRLLHDPLRAVVYGIYTLLSPAVGPTPRIMREPGWDMVSYEPAHDVLRFSYYFGLQAIGAIAWFVLLFICLAKALRDECTRVYAWLPLGWVLFSALFHNIWGDELLLFSPHWSWALMALVILGARHLSGKFVATVFVPIAVSQIYTFLRIKSALETITR